MTTATTTTTTPAAPTGKCRWLDTDRVTGERWLEINGQKYQVERVKKSKKFRLHRLDEATFRVLTYTVDTNFADKTDWTCTCPDAVQRRGGTGCKHCRALSAALDFRPY